MASIDTKLKPVSHDIVFPHKTIRVDE